MDKIKQVFGGKKDEERTTNVETGQSVDPEPQSQGVLRQLLNPGHDKYDPVVHGTTSTVTPGVSNTENYKVDPNVTLVEDPERRESQGGVLKQVLNPGGDKYDEERHGITSMPAQQARVTGETGELRTDQDKEYVDERKTGIMRQILNPGGDKYDEVGYGTTSRTVPEAGAQPTGAPEHIHTVYEDMNRGEPQTTVHEERRVEPQVVGQETSLRESSATVPTGGLQYWKRPDEVTE